MIRPGRDDEVEFARAVWFDGPGAAHPAPQRDDVRDARHGAPARRPQGETKA